MTSHECQVSLKKVHPIDQKSSLCDDIAPIRHLHIGQGIRPSKKGCVCTRLVCNQEILIMEKTTTFRIIKIDRMIDGTGKAIMPKAEILIKDGIAILHIPYEKTSKYEYVDAEIMQMNCVPKNIIKHIIISNNCASFIKKNNSIFKKNWFEI